MGETTTKCRGCGAAIVFGIMKKDGRPKPHPMQPKVLRVILADGTLVEGRESHFPYCSRADDFRTPESVDRLRPLKPRTFSMFTEERDADGI